MRRYQYRAPTCSYRPNDLPYIFNTARLRSTSGPIRWLAQSVLHLFFHCLILLLALRVCAQLTGRPPATPEKLVTDPNQPNLPLANAQHLDECPYTAPIDDCLSCLFGKQIGHGPIRCNFACTKAAVNGVSGAHLNTGHFGFPLQKDTLLHMAISKPQTVPVGPEGPSRQYRLPPPMASYNREFKGMLNEITAVLDFILWHTTLVAFDTFLYLSVILHEFGSSFWTKRETWRKFKKIASSSGNRGICSPCRKTRVFLCIFVPCLLTVCMAVVKRYEHRAVSKQLCGLLAKLPSLRLRRGIKCGRRIQGRLVVSFTVQRSFVMPIRSQPSTFCLAFLRRAACIAKWLSQAVFKPFVFLRGLLLLAGDVETNPGPIQAELVLNEYRNRFVSEMDTNAVFRDFFHHGIISDGDQESIAKADGRMERNRILHACLLRTCTNDALLRACGMIVSVQGNPKMSGLGEDMRRRLESVEEGGGPDGGSGSEGEKEFREFSNRLRMYYSEIEVVKDAHRRDQVMEFITLALSHFKLERNIEDDHRRFVRALTDGIDRVYTELQRKVEYNSIIPLVKERRLVVISGAPGTGKSTLAKKLCQDVSRNMESLSYKLVVKVELRDLVPLVLKPSSFGLEQLMGLFTSAVQMERVVQRMKATGGADTLLILDGYDELPHALRHSPFFINLLTHSLESPLPFSHIILTSRSIVMSEIYHHFRSAQFSFVNIEVLGFTSEQIQLFIDQYFQREGNSELSAKLSAKLDALPHIRGLCSIPVVLSIISRVFLSRKDLPSTLTQIYDDFVCETLSPMFPGLQSTLKLPFQDHDFLKLCEIAYHCTKQQKLIFTKSDLLGLQDKYSDRQTGCGLLTARPVDKLRFVIAESFYFIHLTVQEFLCAVHIALLEVAAQRAIWDEHLGQPHMAQTWRFYCGVTKLENYDLLQNSTISDIEDFDELLMQSFFETQNRDLVAKLMPSVMGDEVLVEPITSYDSLAFGFCLEQHSSLQHLKVDLLFGEEVREVKHLLEPCLRHQQLQTLAIGGPNAAEDCTQIEDLFDRIRNCDSALKGHFGKVELRCSPLSVAVKVLCLQHVREVECVDIQGCEAMDHEVLREMEQALKKNKTLEKLTIRCEDYDPSYTYFPKEFYYHFLLGARQNTSLSYLRLEALNWDCPTDVPADAQGSVQHVTLKSVPVDVLAKLLSWFNQVKQLKCEYIYPPQEAMDPEVLKEMEKALKNSKTLEKLTIRIAEREEEDDQEDDQFNIPKEFCYHILLGTRQNISLSDLHLDFVPETWDCPTDVPADAQGSVQHVTLKCVPVDVLAKLLSWFSQVKQLECDCIQLPQEDEGIEDSVLKEVKQSLSGMGRLEKLVLGVAYDSVEPRVVSFVVAIMKFMSRNQSIQEFVLFNRRESEGVLQDILQRLTTYEQRRLTTGRHDNHPCIRLSPSIVGREQGVDPSHQSHPTLHLQDTQGSIQYQSPGVPDMHTPLLPALAPAQGGFLPPPPQQLLLFPRPLSLLPPCPRPQQHPVVGREPGVHPTPQYYLTPHPQDTHDVPGPSWRTSPSLVGRRHGRQWREEGSRHAQRNRADAPRASQSMDTRGYTWQMPPLCRPTVNPTHFQPKQRVTFFTNHPLVFDVDFDTLIQEDPSLSAVELPIADEGFPREGNAFPHPQ